MTRTTSLICLEQSVGEHRKNNGAKIVKHLVRAIGNGGNFGIQLDQRDADPVLDKNLMWRAGDIRGRDVVPAKAAELAVPARETAETLC